jgi:hypothetical protein
MLAYLFWHAPAQHADVTRYEHALESFHRSLARRPPFGFRGSVAFRAAELPWGAPDGHDVAGGWYEDWYLVVDFAALGVLNEAAVASGHRSSHDRVAKRLGSGTAGLYRLIEGEVVDARGVAACAHATWVAPAAGAGGAEIGALLGDGMDPRQGSVWQRQLVLGPAPEFCVLAREDPAGVVPARLAARWSARTCAREALTGS